ncbi:MAG: hypothetical protein M0P74_17690, partial [Syntrophales bacterium]|nr:hypothetical protein [Syntrophales bacterium]
HPRHKTGIHIASCFCECLGSVETIVSSIGIIAPRIACEAERLRSNPDDAMLSGNLQRQRAGRFQAIEQRGAVLNCFLRELQRYTIF